MEAILTNKLKSVLTALGIIFGVAAVISMLAIGNGAQQEILEQMKQVGVNNIIIKPILSENLDKSEDASKAPQKYSRGLSMADVRAITEFIPTVKKVSPEVSIDTYVIQSGKRKSCKLLGITAEYFNLFNLKLETGEIFNNYQSEHGIEVCIIGEGLKSKLFSTGSPINQYIKCGNVWLKIIGIMEKRSFSASTNESMGIASSNESIYIPIKTMLMRYKNRSMITSRMFQKNDFDEENTTEKKAVNYNQLDKIIVQVNETEFVNSTKDILQRMILRRHSGVEDFEITVPELLLKQQQRTKDIFNLVLGAIASISLIVGGIGIMNIMLASVMERIREIGTRLAIGATKKDIIVQFLSESTLISVTGGIIGVFLGIILSVLITKFSGILTIVSVFSVIIAFGISVAVGIIFGYMPAKRAAEKDPVESLRYE
ncbi:MAG TPA: hypothetical protein DEH02_04435 [Bacteroidales bacterium]|nr:hypothetical protein [Bacteroidales bacterium]